MKRISIIALFILAFVQTNCAQKFPSLTNDAISEYKEKNFDKAKSLIDQSVKSVDGQTHSYTWHLRGHIYKHFFGKGGDIDLDNSYRETSISSFKKSMELDVEGTFKQANIEGLKPLTNSFWNEAVGVVNERDKDKIGLAEQSLERFVKMRMFIGEMENMNQYLIDFYKAFASANRKLIEAERKEGHDISFYQAEFDRVERAYKKVLELNSEDYIANYNLSINLYNEAAYRIEQMPPDADLLELMDSQQGSVLIFEKALPFALKADNIRPGRIETVKALRAVYLALNDYNEFDFFDQMVKKIKSDSGATRDNSKEAFQKMRKSIESYKRIPQSDEE